MALIHPHFSLVLPVGALLVGVVYQVQGHSTAILWALGTALFLMLPDLTHHFVRPFRSVSSMHTGMALASMVLGLMLSSAFPLAWKVNGKGRDDDLPRFRNNHPDQVILGIISLLGLAIFVSSPIVWRRHHAKYVALDRERSQPCD